jgi:hypothetical protein
MKQREDAKSMGAMLRGLTFAVVGVVLYVGSIAYAGTQIPAAVAPQEAKAILMRMAEFMAETKSFSVDAEVSYDVYQQSGQKIEFGETRKITVARPDRLRIEIEESDGDTSVVTFDGKDLGISSPSKHVYAQAAKPGSIDDAVVYFVRDLGMRLPFAVLLLTSAPSELERRTKSLDYVERTSILGTPAHHLAGRTESVDYQVWIAESDKPLLLRLVLTYPGSNGQPQFRAQFSGWNLAPEVSASMFTLAPPAGARRIAFLAQLPHTGVPYGAKRPRPAKPGGQE